LPERSAPPDAFGRTASEYEFGRPEWPDELIEQVVHDADIAADETVLDLGAGTGKLTRALAPRFARVVAVEPDDAMRAVLAEFVPKAELIEGEAEAIPLGDDSVGAVFSGEAFHWFATKATVAEVARVLQTGGVFAFFWNIFEKHLEPPLSDEVREFVEDAFARGGRPGQARIVSGEWRQAFEGSRFGTLHEAEVVREIASDRDHWLANLLSVSSIAAMSDGDRAAFADRVRELTRDAEFRRRFRTVAYWTRLA
jgi:SAM-dependent methyltransferase